MRNARRKLRTLGDQASGLARAAVESLAETAELTRRVAAQTRQRLAGTTPDGATRIVSLHDRDARPIVKGRLGKPVEFGYKAQIVDNEDGVIVDHNVEVGNPPDAPQLTPAIRRIKKRTGTAPRAVTADRGYGEQGVEDDLRNEGVRHVVLPTKGRPSKARQQVENRRAFARWSDGAPDAKDESAASNATSRSTAAGSTASTAPRTWCGHSVFAHNLVKISGLIE